MVIQNIIIRNAYDIQITIIREYIIRVYTTKKIRVYIIRVYEKNAHDNTMSIWHSNYNTSKKLEINIIRVYMTISWAYEIQISILQKNKK